jgi:hypothetical protein
MPVVDLEGCNSVRASLLPEHKSHWSRMLGSPKTSLNRSAVATN